MAIKALGDDSDGLVKRAGGRWGDYLPIEEVHGRGSVGAVDQPGSHTARKVQFSIAEPRPISSTPLVPRFKTLYDTVNRLIELCRAQRNDLHAYSI